MAFSTRRPNSGAISQNAIWRGFLGEKGWNGAPALEFALVAPSGDYVVLPKLNTGAICRGSNLG